MDFFPISPARLHANRLNTRESQSPRTRAGKASSSRNAVRSGCYAALRPFRVHPGAGCLDELSKDPAGLARPQPMIEITHNYHFFTK
jgi:hypothetical protein